MTRERLTGNGGFVKGVDAFDAPPSDVPPPVPPRAMAGPPQTRPERLNAADLVAIEKRAGEASAGPWVWNYEWVEAAQNASYVVVGPSETTTDIGYEEDAVFIAAARSDVPLLAAEVRACWEERERLTAEIHRLRAVPSNKVRCGGDGCPGCPWCLIPSTSPDEVKSLAVDALREPQEDAR